MARNVVVFCLDTVRKDYFDDYARRIKAASDISFDRWYSSSSWTVASHGSMLTSSLPSTSGINIKNYNIGDLPRESTFLHELDSYQTICASANGFINPEFDVDSLFDEFLTADPLCLYDNGLNIREFKSEYGSHDRQLLTFFKEALSHKNKLRSIANGGYQKLHTVFNKYPIPTPFDDGAKRLEKGLKRSLQDVDQPVFLYINLMEAHGPHQYISKYDDDIYTGPASWSSNALPNDDFVDKRNVNEEDLKNLRELYAAAIDYLDRKVLNMIDICRSRLQGETTFLVTSDHGENLGYRSDDFRVGHEASLSEGVIHVPMEIINPPSNGGQPNENALYSHRDFGTLVTGLSQGKWKITPRNMVAAERLGTDVAEVGLDDEEVKDARRMIRAVVRNEEKYIWCSNGENKKYSISPDRPSSQDDERTIVDIPEDVKAAFEADICTVFNSINHGKEQEMSGEAEERLRELGYL